MADRVSPVRSTRKSNWDAPRSGPQDIQAIAGAREWVEPTRTRDDHDGEERIVEVVQARPDPTKAGEVYQYQVEPLAGPAFAGAREQSHIQLETFTTETANRGRLDLTPDPVTRCLLCQRAESECAVLVEIHSGHICDQCTEEAVDAVRAEMPKRRLRLAMERILAGDVTPELVEQIERLSGG